MHVDKSEISKGDAGAVQRQRGGVGGAHQHVLPHVDGGERKAADIAQRLQAELAGTPFAHQQHGGGAVGERVCWRRSPSRGPVKHGFELGVVARSELSRMLLSAPAATCRGHVGGEHLAIQLVFGPSPAASGSGVPAHLLRLAADLMGLGHLLGGLLRREDPWSTRATAGGTGHLLLQRRRRRCRAAAGGCAPPAGDPPGREPGDLLTPMGSTEEESAPGRRWRCPRSRP